MPERMIATIRRHAELFKNPETRDDAKVASIHEVENSGRELLWKLEHEPVDLSEEQVKALLGGLRDVGRFELLARTAKAVLGLGHDYPFLHRQCAQAAIEVKDFGLASHVLHAMTRHVARGHPEFAEAAGLLGRLYKQMYVDDPTRFAQRYLRESVANYSLLYDYAKPGEKFWHGVNVIAVVARARADGVTLEGAPDPAGAARKMIEALAEEIAALTPEREDEDAAWMRATIGEAYVAMGDWRQAADWYQRFLDSQALTAFNLQSAARQLREVWRLTISNDERGAPLALLETEIVRRVGGSVAVSANEGRQLRNVHGGDYQAMIDGHDSRPASWLRGWLAHGDSVARITLAGRTTTLGTGFLVRGDAFHPSLGDGTLLMTNAHVLSDEFVDKNGSGAVSPASARVVFRSERPDQIQDGLSRRLGERVWHSACDDLDTTLLRIEAGPDELPPPLPLHDPTENSGAEPQENTRAYVVGYPAGGELSFGLDNNTIVDIGWRYPRRPDWKFVQYKTSTRPGSSGSPVFDGEMQSVFAIHHVGAEKDHYDPSLSAERLMAEHKIDRLKGVAERWQANQGVLIESIIAQVRSDLGPDSRTATPTPDRNRDPGPGQGMFQSLFRRRRR